MQSNTQNNFTKELKKKSFSIFYHMHKGRKNFLILSFSKILKKWQKWLYQNLKKTNKRNRVRNFAVYIWAIMGQPPVNQGQCCKSKKPLGNFCLGFQNLKHSEIISLRIVRASCAALDTMVFKKVLVLLVVSWEPLSFLSEGLSYQVDEFVSFTGDWRLETVKV